MNAWAAAYIQMNYPNLAWAINHPELGPILDKAVAEGWTEERITATVKQTSWYTTTTDAQRQWELLRNDNPGQAAAELSSGNVKVGQLASQLGVSLNPDQILWIATAAVANGWTEEQIRSNIVQFIGSQPFQGAENTGGLLGSFLDQAKARANEWVVPMSDEQAWEWAQRFATGQIDQQGFDAYMRDLAQSRFPTLKSMFDQGLTTKQIFDPYIQQTAGLLEVTPGQINLLDTKWLPMIDSVDPEGARRPMSLSEAARYTRSTPEYNETQGATETAARTAERIMQTFGAVA